MIRRPRPRYNSEMLVGSPGGMSIAFLTCLCALRTGSGFVYIPRAPAITTATPTGHDGGLNRHPARTRERATCPLAHRTNGRRSRHISHTCAATAGDPSTLDKSTVSKARRGRPRKVAVPTDDESLSQLEQRGASLGQENGDETASTLDTIHRVEDERPVVKSRRGRPRKSPLPVPEVRVNFDSEQQLPSDEPSVSSATLIPMNSATTSPASQLATEAARSHPQVSQSSILSAATTMPIDINDGFAQCNDMASASATSSSPPRGLEMGSLELDLSKFEADETELREEEDKGEGGKGEGDIDQRKSEVEREEALQDKEQAEIQRQGLRVGAYGKERLVYHNDYVVHEELGFCRYLSHEHLEDGHPDEIILEFGDDHHAMPKSDSYKLTRYRAGDSARVPLSDLSDQDDWLRHKAKVHEKVKRQAINVMDLYAKRARIERTPCRPDGPEMDEFCGHFPHEPTPDQVRCVKEIESDMIWRKVPMDRLLCGDVGFGKTEVAIRAMFRAVNNNHQVALLAPTTILAAQHYRTLLGRMPAHMRVALLRGGNVQGGRDIKEAIRNNTLDIVVGTHSLLNRKVEFAKLGLLVIDEEQKFGVNQKEKLKVLATGVDVLTLTATPIPRTLHMSLAGIRDLSTIFSPPLGRQNVTTYIMKAKDEIIERALTREMARGGQVFVVVPRIAQIEGALLQINRCVPSAKVVIGHSKVKNLEDVVLRFTLGDGDILLATSIIENGIDMPNVNSIIIMDSHMFGLSQLYQMRGRVGRSDVAAFTYLLYPEEHRLTNEAKRRLKAMRELSHLGSGFELANRDLEIRGAGNIFGTDQSGDLKDIGYELYMNMLENAIISVKGTEITPVLRCEVDMGFASELQGSIPHSYMPCGPEETVKRLERLRVCNSFGELVRIAKEWVAEYGNMSTPVRRLFKHTHLHTACRVLGIDSVKLEYLPEVQNVPRSSWARASLTAVEEASQGSEAGEHQSPGDHGDLRGDASPCVTLVPHAVLRGPEVEQERWEILFRQGPLKPAQIRHVLYRIDAKGVALRAKEGEEESWLAGSREPWLDHLLSLLLPLVEYVEMKQGMTYTMEPAPRRFIS